MAIASDTEEGTILLAGDLAGGGDATAPQLSPTGVTPGEYKGASIIVDSKGRIVHARSVLPQDVPCATADNCGIVKVTNLHNIEYQNQTISIPQASKTKHGVVKLGEGFGQECCEIFVTPSNDVQLGGVFTSLDGNIINNEGSLDVPIATSSTFGIIRPNVSKGLVVVNDDLTLNVPVATKSTLGTIQVSDDFNINIDGVFSPKISTETSLGIVTISPELYNSGECKLSVTPTNTSIGSIKIGPSFTITEDGMLSSVVIDTQPDADRNVSGIVSISPISDHLSVSSGTLNLATASKTTHGVFKVGQNIQMSNGTISLPIGSSNTKGLIGTSSSTFRIIDGMIDLTEALPYTSTHNIFTKSQCCTQKIVSFSSSITLNLSHSNMFSLTLTGNTTINTPSNLVNGGQYIIIINQDATGGRKITWGSNWKFSNTFGNVLLDGIIGSAPNSINMVQFIVDDNKLIAQIQNNFLPGL